MKPVPQKQLPLWILILLVVVQQPVNRPTPKSTAWLLTTARLSMAMILVLPHHSTPLLIVPMLSVRLPPPPFMTLWPTLGEPAIYRKPQLTAWAGIPTVRLSSMMCPTVIFPLRIAVTLSAIPMPLMMLTLELESSLRTICIVWLPTIVRLFIMIRLRSMSILPIATMAPALPLLLAMLILVSRQQSAQCRWLSTVLAAIPTVGSSMGIMLMVTCILSTVRPATVQPRMPPPILIRRAAPVLPLVLTFSVFRSLTASLPMWAI